MQVLKEGKWKLPWTMEVVCLNSACEATVLVEEGDVLPTYNQSSKYECKCVVCGRTIGLPTSQISLRVQEMANPKRQYSSSGWRD